MDYTAILKKSWNVTWRYKILWLFGLFAGAGGGGSIPSSTSWRQNANPTGYPQSPSAVQVQEFVGRYAPLLVVVALFCIAFGLLMWVLTIAARGGLIHLVNEAEEGREVRASAGWHAGFSKWWRLFGTSFLADLPAAVLTVVMLGFLAVTAFGAWTASRGSTQDIGAAIGTAIVGVCLLLVVFTVAAVVFGVVFGIVKELALRYVVIEDRRVMDALKTSWHDLFAKRGAFLMYLIQLGVGIAYGIVVAGVAIVTVVPGAVLIAFGNYSGGGVLIFLAVMVLLVPAAVYGAFYHAMWTNFFRRMTGAEPAPSVAAPAGYPPVPPTAYAPTPPASTEWTPPVPQVPTSVPVETAPPVESAPPTEPAPPGPADV